MTIRHLSESNNILASSNEVPYRRATVPPELAGATVRYASLALGIATADEWETRFRHGGIWRDKWRVADAEMRVEEGTVLTVHQPPAGHYPEVEIAPEHVLYEDETLIALNKQPGVYVHVTPWDTHGNVLAALRRWLSRRDGLTPHLHLAHQLDRDTSGVLLLTKDSRANAPLQHMFANRLVTKQYDAICCGVFAEDSVVIETGHGRGEHGLFRIYPIEEVGQPLPLGNHRVKYMATEFSVRKRFAFATEAQAAPRTGRTHQIRLHLQALGHPLLGDTRYKGLSSVGDLAVSHHLLHAQRLSLWHPLRKETLELTAPRPPLWQAVLQRLQEAES